MSWAEIKKINSNLDIPIDQKMEDYFRSFKYLHQTSGTKTQYANESDDNYVTLLQHTFSTPVKLIGVYLTVGVSYSLSSSYSPSGYWKLCVDDDEIFNCLYRPTISNMNKRGYHGICDMRYLVSEVSSGNSTQVFPGLIRTANLYIDYTVGNPSSTGVYINFGLSDSFGSKINISIKRDALPSGLNNCDFIGTLVYEK